MTALQPFRSPPGLQMTNTAHDDPLHETHQLRIREGKSDRARYQDARSPKNNPFGRSLIPDRKVSVAASVHFPPLCLDVMCS